MEIITSAELKEIEKKARAKARAAAEFQLREIRRGEYKRVDADAGYRIHIDVTLCPWGKEDGRAYQWGLDTQGTRDFSPTLTNLRRLLDQGNVQDDERVTDVTLCTNWYILPTNREEIDRDGGCELLDHYHGVIGTSGWEWRIEHVTVWEKN